MRTGLDRLLADGHAWVDGRRVAYLGPAHGRDRLVEGGVNAVENSVADVVLVDVPCSGARLAGEHLPLLSALAQAAEDDRPVVVVDRPIPLGGMLVEGPSVDLRHPALARAVALPLRHGLSVGELARLFVHAGGIDVRLAVVPCEGWDRLLGPHPSPPRVPSTWHLPALYVGLACVAAARRWTWTAPSVDSITLSHPDIDGARFLELAELGAVDAVLHGLRLSAHPHGIRITLNDPNAVDAVRLGLVLLEAMLREHPVRSPQAVWAHDAEGARIDRVSGSAELRLALEARLSPTELLEAWQPALEAFSELRQDFLLY